MDAGMDAGMDATPDAPAMFDAGRDVGMDLDAGSDADIADTGVLDAAPPPPGDFCEDVRALSAEPVVDGVLEPGVVLRALPKDNWLGFGTAPPGHDATYGFGYRPDGFYLFIAVVDDNRVPAPTTEHEFCGDAVEVYLDADGLFPMAPKYDVPGTMQFVIAAPVDDATPSTRASRWNNVSQLQGPWTSAEFGTFPTTTGYTFEAVFRAADLDLTDWTLTPGNQVGLSVAIDVALQADDPNARCGHGIGQYFNRLDLTSTEPCGTGAFCTTNAFCVAPLQP
jgi:hypothetical protein